MTADEKETPAFTPQDDLGKLSYPSASCVLGEQGCSSTCSRRSHSANQELSWGHCWNSSDLLSSQSQGNHSHLQLSTHRSALQMLFCRQGKRTDFTPKNPRQRDRDAPEAEIMEKFTRPPAREFWLFLNAALPSVCPTTPYAQVYGVHIPKHTFCCRASAIISAHN